MILMIEQICCDCVFISSRFSYIFCVSKSQHAHLLHMIFLLNTVCIIRSRAQHVSPIRALFSYLVQCFRSVISKPYTLGPIYVEEFLEARLFFLQHLRRPDRKSFNDFCDLVKSF